MPHLRLCHPVPGLGLTGDTPALLTVSSGGQRSTETQPSTSDQSPWPVGGGPAQARGSDPRVPRRPRPGSGAAVTGPGLSVVGSRHGVCPGSLEAASPSYNPGWDVERPESGDSDSRGHTWGI